MMLFILGCVSFLALLILVPTLLKRVRLLGAVARAVVGLVAAVLVGGTMLAMSMAQTLSPGEIGRAYQLDGSAQELTVGYNFVAPWQRIYTWDMRSQTLSFAEGGAADDAFGAQTKNGDYLTAIANITVRIDPDRLDEYIGRFGNERIAGNPKVALILKNELKRAMENALADYETRDLMSNKAKAADEARNIALQYLEAMPFVVETLWFVDFEASSEYETAIRQQADIRMKTDLAVLQESLNKQDAQNNKVKADGEAEVKRIQARADADAAEIAAQNEASIARITAERDAEVKRVQAKADATATTTRATAEAAARIAQDEAEAKGATAIGQAYSMNPQLLEIKRIELDMQWAQSWNGMMPQFQGLEAFSFADLTGLIGQLMPSADAASDAPIAADAPIVADAPVPTP